MRWFFCFILTLTHLAVAQECSSELYNGTGQLCILTRTGHGTLGHAWVELRDACNVTLVSYGAWPNHQTGLWSVVTNHPKDKVYLNHQGIYATACYNLEHLDETLIGLHQYVDNYNESYYTQAIESSHFSGLLNANCATFAEAAFEHFTSITFQYSSYSIGIKNDPMLLQNAIKSSSDPALHVYLTHGQPSDDLLKTIELTKYSSNSTKL